MEAVPPAKEDLKLKLKIITGFEPEIAEQYV